jgi:phosphocarrier protein
VIEKTVVLKNRLGLHARAAAKLVHTATHYSARVTLSKDGEDVDGKSILGLLLLAAGKGTPIVVRTDGKDEAEAMLALTDLVERRFDESE